MRSVDQPQEFQPLGAKVTPKKAMPVSTEPEWRSMQGQPGYSKSHDGRVKKDDLTARTPFCSNLPSLVFLDLRGMFWGEK